MNLSKQLTPKRLETAIGIGTVAGQFTPLIPAGSSLPATFTDNFSTARDNQSSIKVEIVHAPPSGVRESVGALEVRGIPPARQGSPRIKLTITVNDQGHLDARLHESRGGNSDALTSPAPLPTSEVEEARKEWHRDVDDAEVAVDKALAHMPWWKFLLGKKTAVTAASVVLGGVAIWYLFLT